MSGCSRDPRSAANNALIGIVVICVLLSGIVEHVGEFSGKLAFGLGVHREIGVRHVGIVRFPLADNVNEELHCIVEGWCWWLASVE